jgi:hypothetical protein
MSNKEQIKNRTHQTDESSALSRLTRNILREILAQEKNSSRVSEDTRRTAIRDMIRESDIL